MTVSGRPDAGNARRGDSRRLPQSVTPPPLRQHPQSAGTAAGSRGPRAGGDHPSGRERPAHERGHCHREAAGPPQRTGSRAWAPPRRPRCRCDAPVRSDLSFVDRTVLRRRLNYLRPLKVGDPCFGVCALDPLAEKLGSLHGDPLLRLFYLELRTAFIHFALYSSRTEESKYTFVAAASATQDSQSAFNAVGAPPTLESLG